MRKFLRRLLGLDAAYQAIENRLYNMNHRLEIMAADHAFALRDLTFAINELTVKICADEQDPTRRRLSDRIAAEAMKKAAAEDWARRHSEGKI